MCSAYSSYPEYRDSGVEWLGKVPVNWHIKRLKYLGETIIGLTYSPSDVVAESDGVLVLRSSNIQEKKLAFADNVYVKKDIPEKLITQLGDILICARNGSRALIGKNAQINSPATGLTFGAFMSVFRSSYNDYLSQIFNSSLFEYQSGSFLTATINQLTTSNLNNFEVPFPPVEDRQFIFSFLQHETTKIDTLIEKQKQLIELLKEKRQAVISHAVTKGLNPDVKMKDSGVEWLGEVPEHWTVRRLKHTARLQSGIAKGKDLTGKTNITVPMLRVANVQDGYLNLDDVHNIKIEPDQLERYQLQYGDMLMNEGGDNDKLGRGAIWRATIEPCIHQNHVFAIRPHGIEPEWLEIITQTSYAKFYFYRTAKQSTNLASISSSKILELPLLIPPENERKAIVQYVADKTALFEAAGQKADEQIRLLQERRSALISAAVTGKIDVRNWQPPKEPHDAH